MDKVRKSILILLSAFITYAILEIASCNILNYKQPPTKILNEPADMQFFTPDSILGYKPKPDSKVKVRQLTKTDSLIYDVEYSIDKLGRRISTDNDSSRLVYALFFGGSFVFGDGLHDHQTLANCLARQSTKINAYNYGFSGYGPQHLYALTKDSSLKKHINESKGIAFYVFMDDHIYRTIGDRYTMDWGHSFPRFVIRDSVFTKVGTLKDNTLCFESLVRRINKSYLLTVLNVDLIRLLYSDRAINNTVSLIRESQSNYQRQFLNDKFYVVLYPGTTIEIGPLLESQNIKVLDFSNEDYEHLHHLDFHPSFKSNQDLAEELVRLFD